MRRALPSASAGWCVDCKRSSGSDHVREVTMQVIGCQFDIAWEDKAANFERVRALVSDISVEQGALLVLPEMFATGFSMQLENVVEQEQGPTQQFLSQLARETGAHVIGGVATLSADGRG